MYHTIYDSNLPALSQVLHGEAPTVAERTQEAPSSQPMSLGPGYPVPRRRVPSGGSQQGSPLRQGLLRQGPSGQTSRRQQDRKLGTDRMPLDFHTHRQVACHAHAAHLPRRCVLYLSQERNSKHNVTVNVFACFMVADIS